MRYLYALRAEDLDHLDQFPKHAEVGLEVRLDTFKHAPDLDAILRCQMPVLATYRTTHHFGEGDLETRAQAGWSWRLELARRGCSWIDLEQDEPDLTAKIAELRSHGAKVVVSQHLDGNQEALKKAFEQGLALDCDAYKLIGVGRETQDFTFQRWCYQQAAGKTKLVMFFMGEDFAASRVLSLVYGAPFTFVARPEGQAVAAGQLSLADLLETYDIDEMCNHPEQDFQLFSVIGQPIGHSKSPAFHNPKIKNENPRALFVGLPAKSQNDLNVLRATFPEWQGTAVTKPMKEYAAGYANEFIDSGTAALGAANTLLFRKQKVLATNTDYGAMLQLLQETQRDQVVRVLGYGGLGKAVTRACLDCGLKVEVTNRNADRLKTLPEGALALDWQERHETGAAVIVQCTSAGMAPDIQQTPLDFIPKGTHTLFETIYNPEETKLMALARAAGCNVINGTALFDAQAKIQSGLFCDQLGYKSN